MLAVAEDGRLLSRRIADDRLLQSWSVSGTLLWEVTSQGGPLVDAGEVVGDDDWLLVYSRAEYGGDDSTIQRIDGASGQIVWARRIFHGPVDRRPKLIVGSNDDRIGLEHPSGDGNVQRWFDGEDGSTIGVASTSGLIPFLSSASPQIVLHDDSVVRLEPRRLDAAPALHVVASIAPGSQDGPIADLDQPATGGVWFDPLVPGHGLFLSREASAGILFGAVFSHARTGGNAGASNRWFTIQGDLPEKGEAAVLELFDTSGGRFTAGGGTSTRRIGEARVELIDCDRLQLELGFDEGEFADLSSPRLMQRLLPRTEACELQTATSEQPQTLPPDWPSDGSADFDRRIRGPWFNPATAGQGLMVDLLPPTGDGGVLSAAWFTFPPEPQADAPQRWFTLQGPFGADDQSASLVIYRTTGGRLDALPTSNTRRVGEASLTFASCDEATLTFRFDDAEAAAEFSGLEGSIPLQRIAPCEAEDR